MATFPRNHKGDIYTVAHQEIPNPEVTPTPFDYTKYRAKAAQIKQEHRERVAAKALPQYVYDIQRQQFEAWRYQYELERAEVRRLLYSAPPIPTSTPIAIETGIFYSGYYFDALPPRHVDLRSVWVDYVDEQSIAVVVYSGRKKPDYRFIPIPEQTDHGMIYVKASHKEIEWGLWAKYFETEEEDGALWITDVEIRKKYFKLTFKADNGAIYEFDSDEQLLKKSTSSNR